MTTNPAPNSALITRGHRNLVVVAAAVTTLLIALGGIVCATESGAGCPDWPGCYGRIIPPPQVNAVIEYTHRFVAGITTPLILAAAWFSWRRARTIRWLVRPLLVAIPFLFAVIVFGAFAVLTGLYRPVAVLDLGSALITAGARADRGRGGVHAPCRSGAARPLFGEERPGPAQPGDAGRDLRAVCERHPGRRPRLADALRGLALLAPDTRRYGRLAAGGAPGPGRGHRAVDRLARRANMADSAGASGPTPHRGRRRAGFSGRDGHRVDHAD